MSSTSNSAPEGVHEPSPVVIKSLHRLEKRPVRQMIHLVNPVLLRDLHKNFLVAHEPDALLTTIGPQRDLLIGHADQIAFTGA